MKIWGNDLTVGQKFYYIDDFEIKYGDIQYEKEKSSYGWYNCRHEATCTINNFKNCKKDVSRYFTDFNTQWYWHKVDKF